MAKVTSLKSKPIFDPQKAYNWQPDDTFEITGLQLASLFHCLKAAAHTIEGPTPAQICESYNVMTEVLKTGVEQGVVKESNPIIESVEQLDEEINNLFPKR